LSWNKKATIQIDKVTQVKHKITIKILVDKTRMTHKIKKNRTILKNLAAFEYEIQIRIWRPLHHLACRMMYSKQSVKVIPILLG
jgi:hypothetical protein